MCRSIPLFPAVQLRRTLTSWFLVWSSFDHTLSCLLAQRFLTSKLEAPDTFMDFVSMADSFGMCGRLVEILSAIPALGLLQPAAAYNLLRTLYSQKVAHTCYRHGLGDDIHTQLPL